jgi:hypothetical protein
VIETLDPDIVNIAEVTNYQAVQHLVEILHEKGLTEYRAYHVESKDEETGLDIALITKFEPDRVDGTRIKRLYTSKKKGKWRRKFTWTTPKGQKKKGNTSIAKNALYYFTIEGKKLGFLGLVLQGSPGDRKSDGQRKAQAEIAQDIITKRIVGRGYLPIVLGVFNDYDPDVPDRDDLATSKTSVLRLLKDYDPTSAGDELINAASKIKRKFDRYTYHNDVNRDGKPDKNEAMTMVDHILIHKDLEKKIKGVFIDHGHGSQTSDHWPVVLDLFVY